MSDDFAPSLEERFEAHAEAMRAELRRLRVYMYEMHTDLTERCDDLHATIDALRAEIAEASTLLGEQLSGLEG